MKKSEPECRTEGPRLWPAELEAGFRVPHQLFISGKKGQSRNEEE